MNTIAIPENFTKEFDSELFNNKGETLSKLDPLGLLKNTNEEYILLQVYQAVKEISGDAAYTLIHHNPNNGNGNSNAVFKVGHALSYQSHIPYKGFEIFSVPIEGIYRHQVLAHRFEDEVNKKGISIDSFIEQINSKTNSLITASTSVEEFNEAVNDSTVEGTIPVHISIYDNMKGQMNATGLHCHLLSNHVLEESFKRTNSYNTVKQILGLRNRHKEMLKIEHPEYIQNIQDGQVLISPSDEWNSFLVYKAP